MQQLSLRRIKRMSIQPLQRGLLFILIIFACVRSAPGGSLPNSWVNPTNGVHKWETGANWSEGVAPNLSHPGVLITNLVSGSPPTRTVLIDATTPSGPPSSMNINGLTVAGTVSPVSSNFLSLVNVGLATPLHEFLSITLLPNGFLTVTNSAVLVDGAL